MALVLGARLEDPDWAFIHRVMGGLNHGKDDRH